MPYKLIAAHHLPPAGDFKGHLETVTFIAESDTDPKTHKWWEVNTDRLKRTSYGSSPRS